MAVSGFICSLIGLVLLLLWPISIPAEVVGLILSAVGLKKSKERNGSGKGLAIAGIVLSSIGLAIVLIIFLFFASLLIVGVAASNN